MSIMSCIDLIAGFFSIRFAICKINIARNVAKSYLTKYISHGVFIYFLLLSCLVSNGDIDLMVHGWCFGADRAGVTHLLGVKGETSPSIHADWVNGG